MPQESIFDPEGILDAQVEDEFATEMSLVNPDEYQAAVSKIAVREVTTKNGPRLILELFWKIDAPGTEADGRNVRQSIWLDTNAQGDLLSGKDKNVDLGQLREALGQNVKGQPWSPRQLVGGLGRVQVEHTLITKGPREGKSVAEVKRVAAL